MPPKKKAKTTLTTATSTRTTRQSTKNKARAVISTELSMLPSLTPPPPAPPTPSTNGKRKRNTPSTSATAIVVNSGEDSNKDGDKDGDDTPKKPARAAAAPPKKAVPRRVSAPKKPAVPKKPAAPKPKPASKVTSVEKWFEQYENPDTGCIDPGTAQKWMEDLGIYPEGVFLYFILWKCNPETQMTVTKEEFIKSMEKLGVKNNDQLLSCLPELMAAVQPRIKPEPNHEFKQFYKWCFDHFRPEGAKNITVDVAHELFKTLLDADCYSPKWKPGDASSEGKKKGKEKVDVPEGCTPGEFPHRDAFLEYITSDPRPVAVITRDQYDQFYEFNVSVSWSLKEHSEESAWPALLDNYVDWKKKKYPSPIQPGEKGEGEEE